MKDGPRSELARYAFGFSDKKPSWMFWAIHAAMVLYILWRVFTIVPASAQMHGHGGGHGGGGYYGHGGHGGGMGGFHGGYYGGGAGFHEGYRRHHFHGDEGYVIPFEPPRPYCTPWQLAAGMCGPDY